MSHRILIVEDEETISLAIEDRLRSEGYLVQTASDGQAGLREAQASAYDLIILDLMLPKLDGLTVCRELRTASSRTPILILSAKGEVVDRVVGLKFGADDYLPKPFEMAELSARVEALLRRNLPGVSQSEAVYAFGEFFLDTRRQKLEKKGAEIPLSTQEYRLLEYLVRHPGEVLSRDDLLDAVWGYEQTPYTRTVDVHVAWLRQKLSDAPHPRLILTVRGRGYKMAEGAVTRRPR